MAAQVGGIVVVGPTHRLDQRRLPEPGDVETGTRVQHGGVDTEFVEVVEPSLRVCDTAAQPTTEIPIPRRRGQDRGGPAGDPGRKVAPQRFVRFHDVGVAVDHPEVADHGTGDRGSRSGRNGSTVRRSVGARRAISLG